MPIGIFFFKFYAYKETIFKKWRTLMKYFTDFVSSYAWKYETAQGEV